AALLRYYAHHGTDAQRLLVADILIVGAGYIAQAFPVRCSKRQTPRINTETRRMASPPNLREAAIESVTDKALSTTRPAVERPVTYDESHVMRLAGELLNEPVIRPTLTRIWREAEVAARWLIGHSGSLHARLSNALLAERFLNAKQISAVVDRWRDRRGQTND
ncbi:MAG TPA: hypothetical protein VI756_14160, partial [Blastocatellia bacterium]